MIDPKDRNTAFNSATEQFVSPLCVLPDGEEIEAIELVEYARDYISNPDNASVVAEKLYSIALLSTHPYGFMEGYLTYAKLCRMSHPDQESPKISVRSNDPTKDTMKIYYANELERRARTAADLSAKFKEIVGITDETDTS